MKTLKHTQFGWVFFIIIFPLMLFITFFQPLSQNHLIIMWSIGAMILLLFFSLTISVDATYVKFSFGIGLIHGKFLIDDIEVCAARSYVPMGWGIRFRPGVILYNVSGNKAVELIIRGKTNKVWLGTNKPQEIAEFINQQMGSRG